MTDRSWPGAAGSNGGRAVICFSRQPVTRVPPGDTRAMGQAIADLLADDRRRDEMGRAGRRRALDRFGVESVVRRVEAVFDRVLAAKNNVKGWKDSEF